MKITVLSSKQSLNHIKANNMMNDREFNNIKRIEFIKMIRSIYW